MMAGERARVPASIVARSDAARGVERLSISLEVITPLFGGGVHVASGEETRQLKRPDPVTPVRGASIRGQLRFWWRATRGCLCGSLAEMRGLEAALWGAASRPARVVVTVRGRVSTQPEPVFEMQIRGNGNWNPQALPGKRNIAYGAFPLQPPASQPVRLTPGDLHRVQGRVEVVVRLEDRPSGKDEPSFDREVEWAGVKRAVRAWLMFGGLGGRTRRGFGAVDDGSAWDPERVLAEVAADGRVLAEVAADGRPLDGVPSLIGARATRARATFPDASAALSAGLERLQRFRQGTGVGRNRGQNPNHPGRSRWPEPEWVRLKTGQTAPRHAHRQVDVDKTPRAAFGLPIIFHFKDQGDPNRTTLIPADAPRRASPLIIRPYRIDGRRFGVLALALSDRASDGLPLVLRQTQGGAFVASAEAMLTSAEASRIRPLDGNPDVIGAFLDFFGRD